MKQITHYRDIKNGDIILYGNYGEPLISGVAEFVTWDSDVNAVAVNGIYRAILDMDYDIVLKVE